MLVIATIIDQRFRENDENIDARLKTIAGDLY
jgi:ribose 1,5-bisphosphokinase PhnN